MVAIAWNWAEAGPATWGWIRPLGAGSTTSGIRSAKPGSLADQDAVDRPLDQHRGSRQLRLLQQRRELPPALVSVTVRRANRQLRRQTEDADDDQDGRRHDPAAGPRRVQNERAGQPDRGKTVRPVASNQTRSLHGRLGEAEDGRWDQPTSSRPVRLRSGRGPPRRQPTTTPHAASSRAAAPSSGAAGGRQYTGG